MSNGEKSALLVTIVFIVVFVVPFIWRQHRDDDIAAHSLYTFGEVTKQTGSLKNGNHWHYEFTYKNKTYKSYRPTHVDYEVHIGDFFLVNFSSENPKYSRILYEYKLKEYKAETVVAVWDTIPNNMVVISNP